MLNDQELLKGPVMLTSPSRRSLTVSSLLVAFSILLCAWVSGCASGSSTRQSLDAPLVISQQPQNQAVPIGRPATFAVHAYGGAGTLTYQWRRGGVSIAGATTDTYATPDIVAADNGAPFDVGVSDSSTSKTSDAAKLTAGPRAPLRGDLRYLLYEQLSGRGETVAPPRGPFELITVPNAIPTPLSLGWCAPIDGCGWDFYGYSLPTGMSGLDMGFDIGYYPLQNTVDEDVQKIAASNVVIMSLDVETPMNAWAAAWVKNDNASGFDYQLESIPMGANLSAHLQATVAADGAESRIVTAVTFDDAHHLAYVLSYGWQGDTTTAYEAETSVTLVKDLKTAASQIAADGYFISAFGGNDADGYMLVGMRVQGDTMARPFGDGGPEPANHDSAYWTVVAAHQADISFAQQ